MLLAPFTSRATPEAVASLPPQAHRVDVAGDPYAYHRAFAAAWHDAPMTDGFTLVEHDVVLEPHTHDLLQACEHAWCLHPCSNGVVTHHAFGCVRFSAELTTALPDLPEQVIDRTWQTLDCHVFYLLHLAGYVAHVHAPTLRHLNPSYR